MTLLTCAAVRRRLHAFHDRELPVGEQIAVESHVHDCPPCARDLREVRDVGEAMRLAAAPGPSDDWTGLRSGVISRMRAEAHESWAARTRRAFDDMHLVWIGLAATAATFVCAGTVLSMLHFASPERNNSLAAMIAVKAAPSGSNLNPVRLGGIIQVPSVPENGVVYATLENSMVRDDLMLPLSAVVTREGRVSGLELLNNDHDLREGVVALVEGLSRGRLEPAQFGGSPVAVNLVWLVAHTTVRGKGRS
jgi:putative zinc finger protein